LPFVVFMLFGLLEPHSPGTPPDAGKVASEPPADTATEAEAPPPRAPVLSYPLAYTLRIAATCLAIVLVWPAWRQVPWKATGAWWLVAGLVGGLLWIGLCQLALEDRVLQAIGLGAWSGSGGRAAYNPLEALSQTPLAMAAFLAVRFLGLVVLVPLLEEFFARGFLMRFAEKADWWTVPWGEFTWKGAILVTAYGVLAHPQGEMLAAAVWFTLITLLYARTRSLWDCILAHAVTNAMLGIYVMASGQWSLW
jgi:CAAX prenyl protease-like protein